MGEVEVPADALWGAQTQRAVDNFPVSGERIGRDLIGALGCIKGAAARVNGELGLLDSKLAQAIETAAREVVDGKWDNQFVVDLFQTGILYEYTLLSLKHYLIGLVIGAVIGVSFRDACHSKNSDTRQLKPGSTSSPESVASSESTRPSPGWR